MTTRIRASWDEYFMAIARVVATRSTCDRKHVGAVIVDARAVVDIGAEDKLPLPGGPIVDFHPGVEFLRVRAFDGASFAATEAVTVATARETAKG